jgi:segregation and condensation protein A
MDYAREHRKFSFRGLLERQQDRTLVVVTFLALLELMKIGKITLSQEHLFDDMIIETLEPEGEDGELDLSELQEEPPSSDTFMPGKQSRKEETPS